MRVVDRIAARLGGVRSTPESMSKMQTLGMNPSQLPEELIAELRESRPAPWLPGKFGPVGDAMAPAPLDFDSPDKLRITSSTRGPGTASTSSAGNPGCGETEEKPGTPAGQTEEVTGWDGSLVRLVTTRVSGSVALLGQGVAQTYAAEQYRIVRTKIVHLLKKHFGVVITSPGLADGKTFTAVNLAAALALTGEQRTLLIDADLRRASVHRRLQTPSSPGLTDVLSGECRPEEATFQLSSLPGLFVLPAGTSARNPAELLDGVRWRALAEKARRYFAHVIIDSPPVDVVADHDLIAAVADGILLVVRPNHTNRTLCFAALRKVQPKLAGVLINSAEDWFLWKRAHRYHDYYRWDEKARQGDTKPVE